MIWQIFPGPIFHFRRNWKKRLYCFDYFILYQTYAINGFMSINALAKKKFLWFINIIILTFVLFFFKFCFEDFLFTSKTFQIVAIDIKHVEQGTSSQLFNGRLFVLHSADVLCLCFVQSVFEVCLQLHRISADKSKLLAL